MKAKVILFLILFPPCCLFAQNDRQKTYWRISDRQSIVWDIQNSRVLPHSDNLEMAGNKVACIIYYSIDKTRNLKLDRDIIYPQLYTFIKANESAYRAYCRHTYGDEIQPEVSLRGRMLDMNKVDSVEIAGKLVFYHTPDQGIRLIRTLLPSMTERLFIEKWELCNETGSEQLLSIGKVQYATSGKGQKGEYHLSAYTDAQPEVRLLPGESCRFAVYMAAGIDEEPLDGFDFIQEDAHRDAFLKEMKDNLVLETPDEVLNTLFYFSKIRAAENIFDSKMGNVHSPGGGNYYTGVWANDQAEYSGPFFPFLGYEKGNEAAYNGYKMFLKNIPADYQPISSSFEMDGDLPCCARDRGDAAMIAYGASLFALSSGDKEKALTLWPLIEWCLEYCRLRLNERGVVASDTDEMEGRISTGNANLSTSSLYYGGLKFASYLAKELGYRAQAKEYADRQKQIEEAIEAYFGYIVDGLETYRYFEENTKLRHWICLPLAMGIDRRIEGTTQALLGKLWTENGVLVEYNPEAEEEPVFWDRGTLYAFRGLFKAGVLGESSEKLHAFSHKRLLEDHVPYVIEAYPENNMRHLSAESALYCRIFIEGLLGLEPTGFDSFEITPQMPPGVDSYSLRKMHISDQEISIDLKSKADKIQLKVYNGDKLILNKAVKPRERVRVSL